jgi:hypothetical protein
MAAQQNIRRIMLWQLLWRFAECCGTPAQKLAEDSRKHAHNHAALEARGRSAEARSLPTQCWLNQSYRHRLVKEQFAVLTLPVKPTLVPR